MKSNLNAVYGAIQQVDKLLTLIKPADKKRNASRKREGVELSNELV